MGLKSQFRGNVRGTTTMLAGALLLISASLAGQAGVFSTGFEADEGYIGAATAGPASLLVAQQAWQTQFCDDNFHVYT